MDIVALTFSQISNFTVDAAQTDRLHYSAVLNVSSSPGTWVLCRVKGRSRSNSRQDDEKFKKWLNSESRLCTM